VLLRRLDLGEIAAVLRAWRLGWCGHMRRAASCIGSIARLGLPGARDRGRPGDVVRMCERWCDSVRPGWCRPVGRGFMESECEALPGVAYPGVWDNRSTINTKTGYDDVSMSEQCLIKTLGTWHSIN